MCELTKCLRLFYQLFDVVQILSNTIQQGIRTGKCLVTKKCLIAEHFPYGQALYWMLHCSNQSVDLSILLVAFLSSEVKHHYLCALSHLLQWIPKQVLLSELPNVSNITNLTSRFEV